MMITQNINRKDDDYTKTYTAKIPTRRTRSGAVLLMRWAILYLHRYQRRMIRRSDQSRMRHHMTMKLAGSMGGGQPNY